jgi:hypothetical protein
MRFLWPALFVLLAVAVLVEARSGGPPASTVVSDDGCSCHSSAANSGTVVSVAYPAQYLGAARHPIRITSTTDVPQNPAGNKGGFLAWVSHGTFAKRDGSEDWYTIESLDGKSVIKHNFNGDSSNAAQEWKFDWIPPTTDVGTVTLKVWANRVNGDGSANSLDHWNRKHVTMQAGPHGDPPPTTAPPTTPTTPATSAMPTTPTSPTGSSMNATPTNTTPTRATGSPAPSFAMIVLGVGLVLWFYPRR